MEIAKSGVVDGVKYKDYLSLISSLGQVRQIVPDFRAYTQSKGNNVVYFTTRDERLRFGLGRSSKDSRLFYWVFGEDELEVSKISEIIRSSVNIDPRRN